MENTKFTPGPWAQKNSWVIAETPSRELSPSEINFYGGEVICESCDSANAKLIAAAPELLEALNAAYQKFSNIENQWAGRGTSEGQYLLVQMRDAIAKATA